MKKSCFKHVPNYFSWKHILFIISTGVIAFGLGTFMTYLALASNEATPTFWNILIIFFAAGLLLLLIPKQMPKTMQIILFAFVPTICFYLLERCTHIPLETMSLDAVILNLVFYYLIAFTIVLITGSMKIATYVLVLISSITGLANYFVILFRSIPILPWDFFSLSTAVSVAGDYEYTVTFPVLYITLGFLLLFLLAGHFTVKVSWNFHQWNIKKVRHNILGRFATLFLCICGFIGYISILWLPNVHKIFTGLDNTLFTPGYMFRTNGFAVAFIMDLRYLSINSPNGYSTEGVEAILSEYENDVVVSGTTNTTDSNSDKPNIIVIMNEAFSDPAVLGDFKTNADYMPFVHSLLEGADNTISGYMYSSILGGNTANSEFEFLTGNSMAFLPIGSVPYQQYIRSEIGGITEQLKSLGYKTVAMHPYNSTGWNRTKVYDFMNFDEKYFISSFSGGSRVRKYISDSCLYTKIIKQYQDKGDSPLFTFAVTMQNHSGYGDGYDYDNFTVDVEMQELTSKYLNTYLSLMKVSDEAFENLVSYFEKQDEKTIIVMFGDHQPNDYVVNAIYKANGLNFNNMSLEEQQNRYIVPFVLWANYDIEEKQDITISANYISSLVMETANLPMTTYQAYLSNLRKEIPVITANMYIDKDGTFHTLDEKNAYRSLIDTYEKIQYYSLFDLLK